MTEQELGKMIYDMRSTRKKELFLLACCRNVESFFHEGKNYLDKLELFIDGKISQEVFSVMRQSIAYYPIDCVYTGGYQQALFAAYLNGYGQAAERKHEAGNLARTREINKQLELLRDIYNPNLLDLKFSEQAVSLAQQVYEGDDKARGILSDYLEEEGYPDEVVAHLKSGFHPKGCWLVDQILGNK